jgi:hypothetical protein
MSDEGLRIADLEFGIWNLGFGKLEFGKLGFGIWNLIFNFKWGPWPRLVVVSPDIRLGRVVYPRRCECDPNAFD